LLGKEDEAPLVTTAALFAVQEAHWRIAEVGESRILAFDRLEGGFDGADRAFDYEKPVLAEGVFGCAWKNLRGATRQDCGEKKSFDHVAQNTLGLGKFRGEL